MKLSRITILLKRIEYNGRPRGVMQFLSVLIALVTGCFAIYFSIKGIEIQRTTIELQKATIELQEKYRLEELKGKAPVLSLEITPYDPFVNWIDASKLSLDLAIQNVGYRGADSVESVVMLIDSVSNKELFTLMNVSFNPLEAGQQDVRPIGPLASTNLNGTIYISVFVFFRDMLNGEVHFIYKLVKWKIIKVIPQYGGYIKNEIEPVGGRERFDRTPKFKAMMGYPEIVNAIPVQ